VAPQQSNPRARLSPTTDNTLGSNELNAMPGLQPSQFPAAEFRNRRRLSAILTDYLFSIFKPRIARISRISLSRPKAVIDLMRVIRGQRINAGRAALPAI
jgi:hypothetical protein